MITTYRIDYRDSRNAFQSLPVMATSAQEAIAYLQQLGYDIIRVEHSFPSV